MLLAACGERHSAAPLRETPVLNIYNWADYIGYHTVAEFEQQYHIKVVYEFYDSNEVLEAKMLAGRSGYDIVSTSTAFYERQIKAGVYLPLDHRNSRTGRISTRRCSPSRARWILAIAMPCRICMP